MAKEVSNKAYCEIVPKFKYLRKQQQIKQNLKSKEKMYQKASTKHIANSEERNIIKNYLQYAFYIYLLYSTLNAVAGIGVLDHTYFASLGNVIIGIFYFTEASKCSSLLRSLNKPSINFKKAKYLLETTYSFNMVTVVINLVVALLVICFLVLQVWAYEHKLDFYLIIFGVFASILLMWTIPF